MTSCLKERPDQMRAPHNTYNAAQRSGMQNNKHRFECCERAMLACAQAWTDRECWQQEMDGGLIVPVDPKRFREQS
jgi:hypothetical protein